jgi:hypothetical protein
MGYWPPVLRTSLWILIGLSLASGCTATIGEADFDAGGPGLGSGGIGVPGTGGGGGGGGTTMGAGGTTVADGLPCDVQGILQGHCTGCHAAMPTGGAPMSLVTRANLMTSSTVAPSITFAQRALVRMQAAAGQMPPAPNPRASALEIQTFSAWVAAGYPAGTCAGTATGAGGATGTGGRGGAGGVTGTGAGGASGTIPCDVQTLFRNRCTTCHNAPPVSGAPMPLVTYANVTAPSFVSPSQTFAQRALARIQDNGAPMPPAPGTRPTAAEIQTLSAWIAGGYASGAACAGTGGTGGGGGAPDPLGSTPRCTSGTTWTGGNNGSSVMNPGRACVACHRNEDDAPLFAIAGTLYPTGHEPNLCNGANGTNGARVVIVDAANRTITLTPNAAGNFMYSGALSTPFHAKVTYQGRERIMNAGQTTGDCNSCHTQDGANGAPGRITLP